MNQCYLGFSNVRECPNMCQGECGYKSRLARPISTIAREIRRDWQKPYFGAVPYLQAMLSFDSLDDEYGAEDGRTIVRYFLSKASGYRGETARRLKAELKQALKG
jgi:hypothetical protein